MKLNFFQLEPQLAKKIAPVYIISGEEILLKQDAIRLIRKAAKNAGFSERVRLIAETGFDWDQLYSTLYATSMLAEKRLIEFDFREATPNKSASTLLKDYASNPSPDNVLIIDINKLDDKISKSAWYQALEKIGMVVTIWPIAREQLPTWIINRAKKYKITFQPDAAQLLADYVEGNALAAAQAVEKLYLLNLDHAIDTKTIHAVLTDESRFTVFDFIEQLIGGDKKRALHTLDVLKAEGTEAILVLWAIVREIRLLAEMSLQVRAGSTYENLFQKHRVFAKRQPAMRRFLGQATTDLCENYLSHASQIDKIIKGALPGDPWENLQLFCLRLV